MKVIDVHNFGDENVADKLVAGPGLTQEEAERICEEQNKDRHENSYRWARVEPDDYQLNEGFQP